MAIMSVQAVGAYLQKLIEQQGLTVASVAEAAGVQANYIWRLQNGEVKEPGARSIAALVRATKGSIEVATALLMSPASTVDDGRRAAESDQTSRTLSPQHEALIRSLSDEDLDLMIEIASRLRRPPKS